MAGHQFDAGGRESGVVAVNPLFVKVLRDGVRCGFDHVVLLQPGRDRPAMPFAVAAGRDACRLLAALLQTSLNQSETKVEYRVHTVEARQMIEQNSIADELRTTEGGAND